MRDLPEGVKREFYLAQLTGGQGHQVGVVGSGSNLLVADEGVRGLVLKLDEELGRIEITGRNPDGPRGLRPVEFAPDWGQP